MLGNTVDHDDVMQWKRERYWSLCVDFICHGWIAHTKRQQFGMLMFSFDLSLNELQNKQ